MFTPHAAKTVLQEFRQALARDKLALATLSTTDQWVVYTSDDEGTYRNFVNEPSVRETGGCGGGITWATRYNTLSSAQRIANLVRNGHGNGGRVCTLREGYEFSIKNFENLIKMVGRRSAKPVNA